MKFISALKGCAMPLAVAALLAVSNANAAEPGVTDDTIKIGVTGPLTGPVAVVGGVAEGIRARVEQANAEGGVKMGDGKTRKIDLIIEDDGLDPQRTLANVRKMAEKDQVFALVGTAATPNNLAIGRYITQKKVPNLFMYSGVVSLNAPKWEVGFVPSFSTEADSFAEYLKANKPNAKVAFLYLNTETGQTFMKAFDSAIDGTNIKVIERQPVTSQDPTVETQLNTLKASGADTLVIIAAPRQGGEAIRFQSESGWKPLTLVTNLSSAYPVLQSVGLDNAKGIITSDFLKPITSDQKSGDEGVDHYLDAIKAAKVNFVFANTIGQTGYAIGDALIQSLEKLKDPTREELMKVVHNMNGWKNPLLQEGITMTTKEGSDIYPIEALQLYQFDGQKYVALGGVMGFEGKTYE
ncbi:ABC-type branched-chain amino acid transport system, substrate-binding protein [Rhizobium mongolense subsp. loessense]|uniref:ABC-type branched-chain amino acid transport system, substrate-binding protein n=1 Tax=Rhizobium mongolense subsp. loessense TaxID=158890 RepID=A0A1G4UAF3_9HYPH|nr:ABC transporter substrate-binding protein [Rhizobium mongolense]SCW90622.1 ABC-type branched-chain amino acid transport system, substrate-binding protein [Rhizobium mongolense subsp. loessense]